ncbi:uncharacterized protein N7484_007625, partial [Penicillium longicatenatum]|uniref:uncharacterized protein n=1 Tax=Penicillium longicatenatum TaxID=1561947 RepID=UPI0025483CD7
ALVYYAKIEFVHNSGIRVLIRDAILSKTLPGSNHALRTAFTGIARVDRELMILTLWVKCDAAAAYSGLLRLIRVSMGSCDHGSLEKWKSVDNNCCCSPMVFGVMEQLKTFALWGPLYCGLHLATSITATKPTVQNIRIPRIIRLCIPIAYAIGYVIPSISMVLPAPSVISTDQKQIFIAVWQAWAISVGCITTLAFYFLGPRTRDVVSTDHRGVYAFAFVYAAVPHLVSWTISLATVVAPALFHDRYVQALHPSKVFLLPSPWNSASFPVEDVSIAAHHFLRWDCLIGSACMQIWAVTLYVRACRVGGEPINWSVFGAKIVLLTILAGPIGSAVALMWERDNIICYGARDVTSHEITPRRPFRNGNRYNAFDLSMTKVMTKMCGM